VTHRSGLPRHDLLWYNNNEPTRPEMIARFAYLELTADLRVKFQYNNLMFMTAGYLAGTLNGTTREEAVDERLFTPLGMERSNFSVTDSQKDDNFSQPYRENDDDEIEEIPFRNIDLVAPAGAVNSTVNEMSRWLLFNLGGGKVGDCELIQAATLTEIHSPQMTTGATPDRADISVATYGMGWMIDTYRGHRRIHHGGGIDGLISAVETQLEPRAEPIVFEKGTDPRLLDPDYLERFVGTYETATGTKITIAISGDALAASIPGQPTYTLEPALTGRFVLKEVPVVSVGFEVDDSGVVTKAVLHQPGGVFDAPRVEE
jgi:CubicO group peptidase (beta-lactamase class C family)